MKTQMERNAKKGEGRNEKDRKERSKICKSPFAYAEQLLQCNISKSKK